jgi:hypothetical protein
VNVIDASTSPLPLHLNGKACSVRVHASNTGVTQQAVFKKANNEVVLTLPSTTMPTASMSAHQLRTTTNSFNNNGNEYLLKQQPQVGVVH